MNHSRLEDIADSLAVLPETRSHRPALHDQFEEQKRQHLRNVEQEAPLVERKKSQKNLPVLWTPVWVLIKGP